MAFSCDDISVNTKVAKLKQLLKTTDRFDANVTLFVIPKSEEKWHSRGSLAQVLKDAQSCGHEIGLHGLNHFPFETGHPFNALGLGYVSIRRKIMKGLAILNDKLDAKPVGFRAPYHHCSQCLFRVLNDLNVLYDSSKMALTSVLLSYIPPLRAIYVSKQRRFSASKLYHPFKLKLWEIPITQEYTWYNLRFEVDGFEDFLRDYIPKIETGCLVVNSHIGALSAWGLEILKELFQHVKATGLNNLTLQQIAERATNQEIAKAYFV